MTSSQTSTEILRVEHLSKEFVLEESYIKRIFKGIHGKPPEKIKALDDIHFSVHQRETLGILGESGSGKSTLARVLMGIFPPDTGNATLMGQNLFSPFSREARLRNLKRMQMVFQDPFGSLNPRMNVRQILTEPLAIHAIPNNPPWEDIFSRTLGEVGLEPDVLSRYPNEFSGGQRQRIGICRALILDPILLIADEAVSALDVSVQAHILELLAHLRETRQLSLLFISHDVAVVRQLADRILVLYHGRVVESLPADCLLKDPGHPYTKKLLAAALKLREGTPPTESLSPTIVSGDGCHFRECCNLATKDCTQTPPLREAHPGHMIACWNIAPTDGHSPSR